MPAPGEFLRHRLRYPLFHLQIAAIERALREPRRQPEGLFHRPFGSESKQVDRAGRGRDRSFSALARLTETIRFGASSINPQLTGMIESP